MKRANIFMLSPTVSQETNLRELGINCAKLWNEVNYLRRQTYENYQHIDWNPQTYKKYVPLVGSATAQQVVNKNNEAWRSFLALKRLEKNGKLPQHVKTANPPRYWKRDGKYELVILCRNDGYRIKNGELKLSKGLTVKFKGNLKWFGKQGRLEIRYDNLGRKWRVFQPVTVKSVLSPKGSKTCHIDLGVVNLATVWVEGWKQPIAYGGKSLLSDWWYWTGRIAKCQSQLRRVNGKYRSKRLRNLYGIRQRRFRHAVNSMVRTMVKDLYELGVSTIVVGNLKHIRDGNGDHSHKTNSMIHNFWSFKYVVQRFKDVAEEYGIKVIEVSEYKTSTQCPRCNSENTMRSGRLFKCLNCGLEAHRDAVGVLNMANLHNGGTAIGVVAHPLLLKWNGMRWEPKRVVNNQPMNTLEAENLPTFSRGECQSFSCERTLRTSAILDSSEVRRNKSRSILSSKVARCALGVNL